MVWSRFEWVVRFRDERTIYEMKIYFKNKQVMKIYRNTYSVKTISRNRKT